MIAMAKAVYYPKGERQKTIIKLLNSLEGRYSRWDIWQDFIVLSAVSIAKVILIGQKQAVFIAIHKCDVGQRNTVLADRIVAYYNRELSKRVT